MAFIPGILYSDRMEIISSQTSKENQAYPEALEKPINVFIVYETILSCLIAKMLSDYIADYTSREIDTSWHSFSNLVSEKPHREMFKQLKSSDILLLAKAGKPRLPEPVAALMNTCNGQISKTGKPILGIFAVDDEETLEDLAPFQELQNLSSQTGMEFLGLPYVLSRVERCESRDGFASDLPPDQLDNFLRRNLSPGLSTEEQARTVVG